MTSNETNIQTYTFHHAELGSMTGIVTPDNVVQFRAIPYASIPARFEKSILLDHLPDQSRDYTAHGFASPQIFPDRATDGGPFPGDPEVPPSDEFQCLILQLNVPLHILESRRSNNLDSPSAEKLPLLVYIHGGGFILGRIDEQHTTALMVSQSASDGQPVIGASIQYRLGALGYLHTPSRGNANLALNDQRNALRWLQRFAAGFGGDRGKVTVFGESAGSMSICAHLLAPPPREGPLFHRAVLMSGPLGPASAPAPLQHGEARYAAFLGELGIAERGDEGLRKARAAHIDDVVAASAALGDKGGLWLSVQDQDFFGPAAETMTWDRVPELIAQQDWCNDFVLGCTSFEALTFSQRYKHVQPAAFLASLSALHGPRAASSIALTYNIPSSSPDPSPVAFHTPLLRWLGDTLFDAPMHLLARHLSAAPSKRVYRYLFDVRNPFPGQPLYAQPHHWADIYFVFRAHQFRYPAGPPGGEGDRLRGISDAHARFWMRFARGEAPWRVYEKGEGEGEETIMLVGEREGWVERSAKQLERDLGWGYGRCEALVRAWEEAGLRGKSGRVLELECLAGVPQT
ncbi:hypothetical protein G6514_002958 [Epicoccum nigrum]|nr:hypothetical protein G6514_002958 [Epicoccum nigrum]